MDAKKIGGFISKLRKEKGLTQAALAEKLSLSNRAVSKWENGDGLPDISVLPELSKELGVTVDELLSGEKREETKIKVEEVANEKNLLNIFNMCFAFSVFCCAFGALLGGFTEIYSAMNFATLFYNHWEIIFAAVSFFAIILGNLVFYIAAIRLNVIYDKEKIIRLSYKKAVVISALSYIFISLFILRVADRYLRFARMEIAVLAIVTAAVVCIFLIGDKMIYKRLDNYEKKK